MDLHPPADMQQLVRHIARQRKLDDEEVRLILDDSVVDALKEYAKSGNKDDLDIAMKYARAVISNDAESNPLLLERLTTLWVILVKRHRQTNEASDLEEAIAVAGQAVKLGHSGHPDRALLLDYLRLQLDNRYKQLGNVVDLDEDISMTKLALKLMQQGQPDWLRCLNSLAIKLSERFQRRGDIADLKEAVSLSKQGLKHVPTDSSRRLAVLNNLAGMYRIQYEQTGDIADLVEATKLAEQVLQETTSNNQNRAGILFNLGVLRERQYERTGDMADLEAAIDADTNACLMTPCDDPHRTVRLDSLGNKFELRYERTGEIADLKRAIGMAQRAVVYKLHSMHDPVLPDHLGNLSNRIENLYMRTAKMSDLEEAIEMAKMAVLLRPSDHPGRPALLNNLGNKLQRRYKQTGEAADIEEAIKLVKEAILAYRYDRVSEMTDLEEAIRMFREAIKLTPPDHPDRAHRLRNLGSMLEARHKVTGENADLKEASSWLQAAWNCQTASPFHRVQAAAECLNLLALSSKIDTATQLGQAVVDFLPAFNTRLLSQADLQYIMAAYAGVATDACAFLIASGRVHDALQYLEKGRAVIIGQLIDGPDNLLFLKQDHPHLANRYEQLRDNLSRLAPKMNESIGEMRKARGQWRDTHAQLKECIQEIRETAGHERFLLGQTMDEMQACATGGTIVVVNITRLRSDAILVSREAIRAVKLPRLRFADTKAWLGKSWTGRRQERPQKNKEYLEYLVWLWNVCVKPVLDEVCGTAAVNDTADSLPRVWWIGAGLGSFMPFHAAGAHSAKSTDNTFSRVISSYSPSIKALGYAQRRTQITGDTKGPLLLTAMPTTPAAPALPGVTAETKAVTDIATGHMPVELISLPSVDQVVSRLKGCKIVHFACHGTTDHIDPSNSGLILQKRAEGEEEAVQNRLTMRRVSELSLDCASIAYLSACSTAENKALQLSDEVIHVVSGFQVAGFPHVVGCLWPSGDRVCVAVASRFYKSLFQRRNGTAWDGHDVAWALREAVMEARAAAMEAPLEWAQFVHFGA